MTPVAATMSMYGFMIGVLGANLFWICYILAGFIASFVIFRIADAVGSDMWEDTLDDIINRNGDYGFAVFSFIVVMLLWPAFSVCVAGWYVLRLTFTLIGLAISLACGRFDKVVPEISIRFRR